MTYSLINLNVSEEPTSSVFMV